MRSSPLISEIDILSVGYAFINFEDVSFIRPVSSAATNLDSRIQSLR